MGTKRTRICRAAVTAIALMICFGIAVEAAGVTTIGENHLVGTFKIMRRASNSFDVTIPAGEIMAAETSFSMSAGESVKFHAVYEPREASVDYGLIQIQIRTGLQRIRRFQQLLLGLLVELGHGRLLL